MMADAEWKADQRLMVTEPALYIYRQTVAAAAQRICEGRGVSLYYTAV